MSQARESRPLKLREQMAERRWNRARAASARSSEGADVKKGLRPRPEEVVSTPPFWTRRRLSQTAAVVIATPILWVAASAAHGWWMRPSESQLQQGRDLFAHRWTPNDSIAAGGDGLGPVFNANSCAECHHQGGVGGGGDNRHNVNSFEVLPTLGQPQPLAGVIHAAAILPDFQETARTVRELFPIIPRGKLLIGVCDTKLIQDYDPLIQVPINTPSLFGAGEIDQLSTLTIRAAVLQRQAEGALQEFELNFDGTPSGRVHVLADGRVGKFGWKAQFATLEEFVANACAVEVGLTNPYRKQNLPKKHKEDPAAKLDLNGRQFRALVAFTGSLPAPSGYIPVDAGEQQRIQHGRELFVSVGCADCHTPDLGNLNGVYSDFCLHRIVDREQSLYREELPVSLPSNHPRADEWKTPPLWGAADTAPYLHDGSAATLADAIKAHAGNAKAVREAFLKLPEPDRADVMAFLQSLKL